MESICGRLPNITAAGDQDPRHNVVAASLCRGACCVQITARRHSSVATTPTIPVSCRGCDFNFFKHVFLERPDLFEANELQKSEKCYYDLHARYGSAKQIGKTQSRVICHPLQDNIYLLRNTETFRENFLHVLPCFDPFDHRLECVDQLKNSNFFQAQRLL